MPKLLVIADVQGWAYQRRMEALAKYAPAGWEVRKTYIAQLTHDDLLWCDVCFNLEYAAALVVRQKIREAGAKCAYTCSYNSDSRRRGEFWGKVTSAADYTVCNNREVFEFHGRQSKTCCISNGVDVEIFRPIVPMKDRPQRAIWCGSTSMKKGKGWQDILKPIMSRLEAVGVHADFRPIDHIDEKVLKTDPLVEWYNSASVVVCASSTEGTPNFVTEAAACGCAVVTTKVGNALEWGIDDENLLFADRHTESVYFGIVAAMENRDRLGEAASKAMQSWAYGPPGNRAAVFFNLFHRMATGETPPPFTYSE